MKRVEEMVCILCPVGCRLHVELEDSELRVTGNRCVRGLDYARQEMFEPLRVLTSSVLVIGGDCELVSVKTNKPVPKRLINQIMDVLKQTKVEAPVKVGDVLVPNVLETGADVVATRSVGKA